MSKVRCLRYEDVNIEDLEQINALYQRYLNGGEDIRAWLRDGLCMPEHVGVKCVDGDRIVGVFTARPGIDFTCDHPEIEARVLELYPDKKMFSGETLVVLPEYRGLGIARELARGLRERLLQYGCDCMIAEEWRRRIEKDVPASGVLKYLEGRTELVGVYPDFYVGLTKTGMTCPQCGSACSCGALVCVVVFH